MLFFVRDQRLSNVLLQFFSNAAITSPWTLVTASPVLSSSREKARLFFLHPGKRDGFISIGSKGLSLRPQKVRDKTVHRPCCGSVSAAMTWDRKSIPAGRTPHTFHPIGEIPMFSFQVQQPNSLTFIVNSGRKKIYGQSCPLYKPSCIESYFSSGMRNGSQATIRFLVCVNTITFVGRGKKSAGKVNSIERRMKRVRCDGKPKWRDWVKIQKTGGIDAAGRCPSIIIVIIDR